MKDLIVIMGASKISGTMQHYMQQLTDAGIAVRAVELEDGQAVANAIGLSMQVQRDLIREFGHEYKKVIFSDAWDVTFYGTKAEVMAKIPDDGVLIAAERNCYPDASLAAKMPGGSAWKFANGGLFAGTPESLLTWLDALENHPSYSPHLTNQGLFNLLRFNKSSLIRLDERTELFYCLFNEQRELGFDNGYPVNTVFGTRPNFIHANGHWPLPPVMLKHDSKLAGPRMTGSVALAIGLAFSGRPVPPEFALTFASQNYPLSASRQTYAVKGREVGEARNGIAEMAVADGARFLWFIDDDLSFPAHACRSLIATLENSAPDVMVAAGIYPSRSMPSEPIVYRGEFQGAFWKWKAGDVFECSGIGTGMMMIRTDVLKHLPKPWFATVDKQLGHVGFKQTDDLYFCEKVRNAGFKILADSNVIAAHWGYNKETNNFTPYMLAPDSYPMRPVSAEEPRCERAMLCDETVSA